MRGRRVFAGSIAEKTLRALCRFDWVTAIELGDALSLEQSDTSGQSAERAALSAALPRFVRKGWVEKHGESTETHYKITAAGRRHLARIDAIGLPIASDREAAEPGREPCLYRGLEYA